MDQVVSQLVVLSASHQSLQTDVPKLIFLPVATRILTLSWLPIACEGRCASRFGSSFSAVSRMSGSTAPRSGWARGLHSMCVRDRCHVSRAEPYVCRCPFASGLRRRARCVVGVRWRPVGSFSRVCLIYFCPVAPSNTCCCSCSLHAICHWSSDVSERASGSGLYHSACALLW